MNSHHLQTLDGDIHLGALLGEGSAGTVFTARQESLDREVAVKRLHKLEGAEGKRRFAEEAEIMARVAHTNIVPILCHGLLDGTPVLVMERVEGLDLAAVLRELRVGDKKPSVDELARILGASSLPWKSGTPWWRVAADLIAQLARALDHAHRSGVLHRDLKPSNVLVSRNGTALLADFGIAESQGFQGEGELGAVGRTISTSGNLAYSAPEVFQGAGASRASDLYSLGVIARELVSLEAPYGEASGAAAQIFAIDQGRLTPLDRGLSRDLRAVLEHATLPQPDARYPSSGDFGRDLEAVLQGRSIAIKPEGQIQRAWRWVRRNPVPAGIGAGLLVLLVAVPSTLQYTRLRAALRVQAAAAMAQNHLGLALAGVERMLVDVGSGRLQEQPRLDLARTELMEAGVKLCDDLAATMNEGDSPELSQRIDAVRVKAMLGLVSTHSRVGQFDQAQVYYERLEQAQLNSESDLDELQLRLLRARIAYKRLNLAYAKGDFESIEQFGPRLLTLLAKVKESDEYLSLMRASVWGTLVESSLAKNDIALAVERGEQATVAARSWVQSASSKSTANRELARVLGNYAAALIQAGRLDEGEARSQESVQVLQQLEESPEIQTIMSISWNNIAAVARQRSDYDGAEQAERRALGLQLAALEVSPRSRKLLFMTGRTEYRIAHTLNLRGINDSVGETEVLEILKRAYTKLENVCSQEPTSLDEQLEFASAAALFGFFSIKAGASEVGQRAYTSAAQACEVAESKRPGDAAFQNFRGQVWMQSVGWALKLRPASGIQVLENYHATFPGNPQVVRNVASMLCVLARKLQAGDRPEVVDRKSEIQKLDNLALDYLFEAADLGGLELKLLNEHPTWKRLRTSPRYPQLHALVSEAAGQ